MGISSEALIREAEAQLPDAVALRRRIHAHPELGLELPLTKRAVLDDLTGLDLEVVESRTTSGVVATLRGGRPGPTLLLRGDMDALPMPEDTDVPFRSQVTGAMHACGHDAHVAMLARAAHVLHAHREQLAGQVRFVFQPGEEGHHGARYLLEEGLLDGADAAFALHIFPLLPCGTLSTRRGPILASADTFQVELVGKGGHASMPHDAVDPIPVACELVQALQSFMTRSIPAFDPAVLTVARIEAGTTLNVIPENARLAGTIRSLSEASRARVHAGLERVTRGVAAAHGLEARVELERGYPVTVNHDAFTDFALDTARALLGSERVHEAPTPAMGAEDWSYVLQRVPGNFTLLGVRPDDAEPAPCHSNRMVLNESGLATGIAMHAALALRYLDGTPRPLAPPGD